MFQPKIGQPTMGGMLRKIRNSFNFSAEDIAGLVGVTPRMVSAWEADSQRMPLERMQLLIFKLQSQRPDGETITILGPDGQSFLDVVCENNFAGFKFWGDDTATIKSLAVDRLTGNPVIHATRFHIDKNEHVLNCVHRWQRNLLLTYRSEFEPAPDPVIFTMATWLANRIRDADENNPQQRKLKDFVAQKNLEYDRAQSQEERDACLRAIEDVMPQFLKFA